MKTNYLTLFFLIVTLCGYSQVGINTTTPNALLDIDSNDKGILIPRVILTSANIVAPVANPNGGAILESTLVYNTATSGVSPNNVYPGFYYWNGTRWVRFNVDGENNPTYYTAVGTFDSFSFSSFTTLSQMTITFTPKDDVALVNFSAAGHRFDSNCINRVIFFQIVLNGVPVSGWQTSANQSIVNPAFLGDDDITTWETNFSYPVNVTVGIPQTIQIQWATPNCQMRNSPSTPFSAFGSIFKSYRVLTVIDPNGGGGIVGTPPVTTNVWSQNGNTGTNPFLNFVGTADGQPLILKSNNNEGLRIATNGNVGIGSNSPLDRLHVNGNIRMVDGNQAAGRVLTSDVNGTASWQNALENAWGITGNSGINPTTNFIGTSDNQSVAFRTNGLERMRLDTSGNLGLGLTTPSERLHVVGNIRMVDGNQAAGSIMVSNADGTASWQTVNVPALNGWSTLGNTGLSAATNFIGTTNAVDVIFRRNNLRAGRLGVNNTSFGVNALNPAGTGTFNTAVGSAALQSITNGARNVAIGSVSLNANTEGNENTAVGVDALSFNETGNNNTVVGRRAMGAITGAATTGSNNTAIGYFAYSTGNFTNSTALGANTVITASNQIRVGNNTVTSIGGTVGFTNLSDSRFKKNIQNDVPGLTFINKLKPVTYQLDMESMARFLNTPEESRDRNAERIRENTLETGFIAQEVEQAAREAGFVFSGVDVPKGKGDYYGLRYASFVVPLVKAMQEQQIIIEHQQTEINQLKSELSNMQQQILQRLEHLEQK